MTFHVGQKVVCIDTSSNDQGYIPLELVKGRIYTVSGIDEGEDCDGDFGLFLEEVLAVPDENLSDSFKWWRFRPVVERKTSIEIFTAMLKPERVDA